MDSSVREFFEAERRRVFEPGTYFPQRVMLRLKERPPRSGFWEIPVRTQLFTFALALMLLFALSAFQALFPAVPHRSLVTAYFEAGMSPSERLLYAEDDVPTNAQLEQMILIDDEN
jgi:hypothetical protein